MESSFAADFSDVRVRESASASALGADAYTKGNEITFAPGRFQPSSKEGKELLGHELSHVVQQRAGRVSTPQAHGGTAINADASLEREADEHGAKAARGEPIGLPGAGASSEGTRNAATTGSVQLKKGKANRRLKVTIAGTGVVELPRGTQIDTQDEGTLLICSGQHTGKTATFDSLEDGAVEFEKSVQIGTHEVYKGCSTGFVGRPKATRLSGDALTVVVTLQTRNVYDRATWTSRVVTSTSADTLEAASFVGARDDDDAHVQNPAWTRGNRPIPDKPNSGEGERSPHGYAFRPDFDGYAGVSTPSALRTITFQYNINCLKRAATKQLGLDRQATLEDIQKADVWIALGINCRYDERGLTPSYKSRDADPLELTCPEHMYGVTAMSTPWQNGLVDMSAVLDQGSVEHMSKEEFMDQALPPNPTNNLELVFPEDYLERNGELAPLVPARFLDLDDKDTPRLGMDKSSKEIQLKLQTRIESEATLKVGSKDALHATVEQLRSMGDTINEIMSDDEALGSFNWTLTPTETLVFTDEYMDDSKCTALRSGIGIRKRRSSTASKLNVKTGKGYQVREPTHAPAPGERYPEDRERGAKSDIYRRHEIGFSLNPEATPEEIGAFLDSGVMGEDPWNLGAHEAMTGVARDMEEKGIDEFDPINFAELQTQMVLMGFRRKFNLCAKPKAGQGVINIEISCDHTVGCKPSDIPLEIPNAEGFEAYFATLSKEKFPEVFNVEMELEHLGAGGATPSGGSDSGRSKMQALRSKWGHQEKKSKLPESAPKAPPEGFPTRRPYQRTDSDSPNFNTQSFSVFYAAHKKVIDALQTSMKGDDGGDYLQSDKQKLESLRDKLGLLDDVSSGSPKPRVSSGGHTKKSKHSDRGSSSSHGEDGEEKPRELDRSPTPIQSMVEGLPPPKDEEMLHPTEHRRDVERDKQTTSPSRSLVSSSHDSFSPLPSPGDEMRPTKSPAFDTSVGVSSPPTPVLVSTPTQIALKSYRLKENVRINNTGLQKGDRVTVQKSDGVTVTVSYFTLSGFRTGDMPASALDLSTAK